MEVADQVYETVLHEEVYHSLAPRDPFFFEVHVQVLMIMGYLKRCRSSSRSGRCSNVEGVRYAPMGGVRVSSVTISQLTTFSPW